MRILFNVFLGLFYVIFSALICLGQTQSFVLKNGLETVLISDDSSNLASVRVLVRVGAMQEGSFLGYGLSHYLEHLLAGGSTSLRSESEVQSSLVSLGGANNAYTTLDHTAYYIHTSSEHVNDADGDRHSILDEEGKLLTPEEVAAIIIDFFIQNKRPIYGIATTIASSSILYEISQKNDITYIETAVGFKHFSTFLKQARKTGRTAFAIESSGGFTCSFHTLEKCGFLPIILLLLIHKSTQKPISELVKNIHNKYGSFFFKEKQIFFSASKKKTLIQYIETLSVEVINHYFPDAIDKINRKDGCKIVFNTGDWVLIRFSGTEPVARIYTESRNSTEKATSLLENAHKLFEEAT